MDQAGNRVEVLLPEDASAAAAARAVTRTTLLRWRMPKLVDDASMVVSELVGNGIRHAYPPFKLALERRRQRLHVAVHDGSSVPPANAPADGLSESGRGLSIIRALSDTLDVREIAGDGKIVSAILIDHPEINETG